MKELSLSVSTGGEGKDNTVVITGKFDTHQEAVLFHAQVAKFCADATRPSTKSFVTKFLPRPS
jgi:hypothetical protein